MVWGHHGPVVVWRCQVSSHWQMRLIAWVSVDGGSVAEGERQECEWAGDAVGDAVVAVASGWSWLGAVGAVWAPPAGEHADGFGESHEVGQYLAQEVVVADAA